MFSPFEIIKLIKDFSKFNNIIKFVKTLFVMYKTIFMLFLNTY